MTGIRDTTVRQRLLRQEKLTLDQALHHIRAVESAATQMKAMALESFAKAIKYKPQHAKAQHAIRGHKNDATVTRGKKKRSRGQSWWWSPPHRVSERLSILWTRPREKEISSVWINQPKLQCCKSLCRQVPDQEQDLRSAGAREVPFGRCTSRWPRGTRYGDLDPDEWC